MQTAAPDWSPTLFMHAARLAGANPEVVDAALEYAQSIICKNPANPVIFSLNHLANEADVPYHVLERYTLRGGEYYRVFSIRKRTRPGQPEQLRSICVPEPFLNRVQSWIAKKILNSSNPHAASKAYAPNCTLYDAVSLHCGARWLLRLDLQNFFESITEANVFRVFLSMGYPKFLSFQMARITTRLFPTRSSGSRPCLLGVLPQGAPSSPMLANLAVRDLDGELTEIAQARSWVYTRYADDLAFSTGEQSTRDVAMTLQKEAILAIRRHSLSPNRQKTTISPPGARKILLGLNVDTLEPRLPKAFKNNVETHVYAITNPKLGLEAHRKNRGFRTKESMIRHVMGIIAFARSIEPSYATQLYDRLASEAVDY